jgi:2-hydroxychromene-2-carboxylate isomerase
VGSEELHWYFDFSSPFGYLSSLRIREVAQAAGVQLVPKPFLLGALFKGIGTPRIPMATFPPPKVRYLARDLKRWAAWWGGPFEFTKAFPLRTVLPLRVALLEPKAIQPLYKAAWADNRDIGQPEVVHAVLTQANFDADALIAGTQDPAIKQELKDNTAAAQSLGVPGVPTFRLPDGQLIWGQDRMDVVASLLD